MRGDHAALMARLDDLMEHTEVADRRAAEAGNFTATAGRHLSEVRRWTQRLIDGRSAAVVGLNSAADSNGQAGNLMARARAAYGTEFVFFSSALLGTTYLFFLFRNVA